MPTYLATHSILLIIAGYQSYNNALLRVFHIATVHIDRNFQDIAQSQFIRT